MPVNASWPRHYADLTELLAEASRSVPPEVAAVGRAVYTWRTVDAELRALLGPAAVAPCPPHQHS